MRARVTEGLSLASNAKTMVSENASSSEVYSQGWTAPDATENVDSIAIDDTNGTVTVTYTASAGGGTLNLIPYTGATGSEAALPDSTGGGFAPPSGNINWICAAAGSAPAVGSAGDLEAKYAPANCR
nr:pilin [Algiphilus sp.]